MRGMSAHTPVDPAKMERQRRLEETLKENLRRRKTQARARSEGAPQADEEDPSDERNEA